MKSAMRTFLVVGAALLVVTVAAGDTHTGDWDVTGEITASGNFATFGDSSYVTPFSGWSGSSRMVAVRQPTAVSSGVSAGFMFSNNQTGNSQNIAQLMFLNEAIGAAEKRVAQILVQTGGTTDSGKMYFRVFNGGSATNALTINRFGTVTVGDGLTFPDGYTQTTAFMGATSGGEGNTATGDRSTVGGGWDNSAGSNRSTVAGGQGNTTSDDYATIAGGALNTASGYTATVGGGESNTASGTTDATVGGGYQNTASATGSTVGGGYSNNVTDDYGTIGGGENNQAGDAAGATDDAPYGTVGGGQDNIASGYLATVGGGHDNTASASYATVGGGDRNEANYLLATVGGGEVNTASGHGATVGGGTSNIANGWIATVSGGSMNDASGTWATVPGGYDNDAGGTASFAAGRRAKASHDGAFLWAGSYNADFSSAAADEFAVRAGGGLRLYTSNTLAAGVTMAAGSSSWSTVSQRSAKENFEPVDGRDVLEKVAAMPIETWNYKAQDASIRHIGPMAEDFRAAFAVGDFEKRITAIDADGVALAAIQGLNQKLEEKDAEIRALRQDNASVKARLAALEEAIAKE